MRRALRSALLPVVLAVLLIAVVGAEVVHLRDRDDQPGAPAAVTLTRSFASAVTSYDYRHVDDDIARVLALGTSEFEADFRHAMGDGWVDRIVANKRTSAGHIVAGPTVQRSAHGRATLLVVVDQTITTEGAQEAPQVVRLGLLVTAQTGATPKVTGVQVL